MFATICGFGSVGVCTMKHTCALLKEAQWSMPDLCRVSRERWMRVVFCQFKSWWNKHEGLLWGRLSRLCLFYSHAPHTHTDTHRLLLIIPPESPQFWFTLPVLCFLLFLPRLIWWTSCVPPVSCYPSHIPVYEGHVLPSPLARSTRLHQMPIAKYPALRVARATTKQGQKREWSFFSGWCINKNVVVFFGMKKPNVRGEAAHA